jgi:7,8-dihydropterin-6-yl-methyl-4-(beta-D-ribofuranosyl)aminobenzene 5'-phosphate synthase
MTAMIDRVEITVLVDNTARGRALLGEHGLALWIVADGFRILFDTGQGGALAPNAAVLGVDLASADAVVLSHGHYDHTGGLAALPDTFRNARLYMHPDALTPRYSRAGDRPARAAGAPLDARELPARVREVIATRTFTTIRPGIHVTGEIPRQTPFEDTGGTFSLDAAGHDEDPIIDDQALCIETQRGIIVVLGCAHAGVVNTLNHIAGNVGDNIHAVVGGMHLLRAREKRLAATVAALRRYDVRILAPGHCTGRRAIARLADAFPQAFCALHTGLRMELTTG